MNYCRKCRILFEHPRCPHCGNRYVDQPGEDDFCFLTESPFPWWEVLEQALKDDGIPVAVSTAVVGAWMTVSLGRRFERARLFVPYSHLNRARELVDALFNGEGEAPEFDLEDIV